MKIENEMKEALSILQSELYDSGELSREIDLSKMFTAYNGRAWIDDRDEVLDPRIMKKANDLIHSIAQKYQKQCL